jgi:hypothetical protein
VKGFAVAAVDLPASSKSIASPPDAAKLVLHQPEATKPIPAEPIFDPETGGGGDTPAIQEAAATDPIVKGPEDNKPDIGSPKIDPIKLETNNIPLDIKLETSRTQPTVGSGLGIQALIKNTSNTDVYFKEKSVVLVLPPELLASSLDAYWYGYFPTNHNGDPDKSDIMIKPGGIYLVDWHTSSDDSSDWSKCEQWVNIIRFACQYSPSFVLNIIHVVATELNFVFFVPGDYKISVIAQYWTNSGGSTASGSNPITMNTGEYRTATQAATVRVAAPQSVILLGAALGGLIAFFIFPHRNDGPRTAKGRSKMIAGMAGAMLLSMIVTILLARISETQFLIRVTVADFWGAIAVGFVANYVGVKIFDRILPRGGNPRTAQGRGGNGGAGNGGAANPRGGNPRRVPAAPAVAAVAAPAGANGGRQRRR